MTDIKIDFERVQELTGTLGQALGRIRGHLSHLDGAVSQLLPQWTGKAADAYAQAQSEWTASLNAMANALEAARTSVGSANEAFQETEKRATHVWG